MSILIARKAVPQESASTRLIDSSKNAKWFPCIYVCGLDGIGKDEIYLFRQKKVLNGKKWLSSSLLCTRRLPAA